MKVTNEEFQKIQEIRQQGTNLMNEFGRLKMDEIILKRRSDDLTKKYDIFTEEEKNFFDLLTYKYGKVIIDLETGEITEESIQS
jgi:hypothetical protein